MSRANKAATPALSKPVFMDRSAALPQPQPGQMHIGTHFENQASFDWIYRVQIFASVTAILCAIGIVHAGVLHSWVEEIFRLVLHAERVGHLMTRHAMSRSSNRCGLGHWEATQQFAIRPIYVFVKQGTPQTLPLSSA